MMRPCTGDLIAFLNEALERDREAISALFFGNEGVPCNAAMADHPTIQVGTHPETGANRLRVLGLLNGFCGSIEGGPFDGCGWIQAEVTKGSRTILRFHCADPHADRADPKLQKITARHGASA